MAIGSNNQYAAGPFKANDLIVNNQAMFSNPGMMALVAKEARKGTSGFFEIPNRERKEAPFLTAAKEKVNQDLGLSPAVQGGMKNFLGESDTVEDAPKKWQSSPDAPATELAYITDAEKKLLLDANLHDSLDDGMPNQGPSGIISLDGGGSYAEETKTDSNKQGSSTGADQVQASQQQQQDFAEYVASKGGSSAYESSGQADQSEIDKVRAGEKTVEDRTTQEYRDKMGMTDESIMPFNLDVEQKVLNRLTREEADRLDKYKNKTEPLTEAEEIDYETLLGKTIDLQNVIGRKMNEEEDSFFDKTKDKVSDGFNKLKKLLKGKTIAEIDPNSAEGKKIFDLLNNFERFSGGPLESRSQMMSDLGGLFGKENLTREDGESMTLEGLTKALRGIDMGKGNASALESLKKYNPEAYFKAFGAPQTSGGLEDFGMNKTIDTSGMDRKSQEYQDAKRYNNAIFSARETTQDKRSRNNVNAFKGGYQGPVVEKDPVVTEMKMDEPTIDPAVGTRDFASGQKYELPTNYRAALTRDGEYGINKDPLSIAYTGGFNQMEDMDEYLKRIGRKRKNYLDADGNPIMTNAMGGL